MIEMGSVVLYATDAGMTVAFYRAIGLELGVEDNGEGPAHFVTELGPMDFVIYPAEAPGRARECRSGGSFFLGFYVESLDRAVEALIRAGSPIEIGHEQTPWGCRAVTEDPDGRTVEVKQWGHCPCS